MSPERKRRRRRRPNHLSGEGGGIEPTAHTDTTRSLSPFSSLSPSSRHMCMRHDTYCLESSTRCQRGSLSSAVERIFVSMSIFYNRPPVRTQEFHASHANSPSYPLQSKDEARCSNPLVSNNQTTPRAVSFFLGLFLR